MGTRLTSACLVALVSVLGWLGNGCATAAENAANKAESAPWSRFEPALRFARIGLDDGLSQASARSVLRDRRGFVWIGTQEGLNRYDGYRIKVYKHDPGDPHSLSDNFVQVLYQSQDEALWLGTSAGGLNRFDPVTARFHRYRHDPDDAASLSNDRVTAIVEHPRSGLWIGTAVGLNRLDPVSGRFVRYRQDPVADGSLPHDYIRALAIDAAGDLWVGTDGGGLARYDAQGDRFIGHRHRADDQHSLGHDAVWALSPDVDGSLWIGTFGAGVNRYDPATGQFDRQPFKPAPAEAVQAAFVTALHRDSRQQLWIGTWDVGLHRIDLASGRHAQFRHDPGDPGSLSHDQVLQLHGDRSGVLWAATVGGLSRLDPRGQRFGRYRHGQEADAAVRTQISLGQDWVRGFLDDPQGGLWVATQAGLNHWQPALGRYRTYRHDPDDPHSLSHDDVRCIVRDLAGRIWVGTAYGLNRFDPGTGRFQRYLPEPGNDNSLSHHRIASLLADADGSLWIGTWEGGLNHLEGDHFRQYRHDPDDPHSLAHNAVQALLPDDRGGLWVGTWGGGLHRFDRKTGRFQRYRHQPDDPHTINNDNVVGLHRDRDGVLWLATQGGGLNRFAPDTGQARHYTERDGLANDSLYGILEDDRGQLWLSSNNGLSRFDPVQETFRNYTESDGLQHREFNRGAFLRLATGELLFGGIGGFNRFDPARIRDDPETPTVLLTELLLANQPVAIAAPGEAPGLPHSLPAALWSLTELTLSHRERQVAFEFAALHFADPERNRFAYRLQGFDPQWIDSDHRNRRATYTGLPPGEYTLQVKASNADGVWNKRGASLRLTVLSPPWRSPWAYTGYALALGLSIFGGVGWRLRHLAHQRDHLEALVGQRTRELQASNQHLLLTQQKLVEQEKMAALGTLTAGVAHEINNPINFAEGAVQNLQYEQTALRTFLHELAGNDAEPEVLAAIDQRLDRLGDMARTAQEGHARVKAIVRDLRQFTRLDEAERKVVAISEPILAAVNLARGVFEQIEFELDLAYDPVIDCLPGKLAQALMNLIVNAGEAIARAHAAGQIAQAGVVSVCTSALTDGRVQIDVQDNGCGIEPSIIEHIFEPFFTSKTVGEGTGLGLAIVFGIVREHKGDIEVESQLGRGSRFRLRLPLAELFGQRGLTRT